MSKTTTRNGLTFTFENEGIFDFLYHEIFEHETYQLALDNPRLIIDAGANIGMAALYFAQQHPNAEILCFEPHPRNISLLEKNIEDNNFEDRVSIQPYALSGEEGLIDFYAELGEGGDTTGASIDTTLGHLTSYRKTQVDAKRLSSYIDRPVDLLKLDVEGAELDVLKDMSTNFALVNNMTIEVHGSETSLPKRTSEITTLLENGGFRVTDRGPDVGSENKDEYEDWAKENNVYVTNLLAKRIK